MIKSIHYLLLAACALAGLHPVAALAAKDNEKPHPLAGMPLRNIGPALISGRVSHFVFNPRKKHEFYVATASGGIWKTSNNTLTWDPVFDHEGSYSVGTMAMDPNNPLILWVGSGENNSQRSVAFGDGVYKSVDGGKTWKNVGLKESGHIAQIWINPSDSDHVRISAQGPLWNGGGDRGLYETRDGGGSWERLLAVDEYTGANEFVVDPRNPDHIVASTYQRHRHVWVLINGGPGSGLHKSTDGGKTWRELKSGLPKEQMGRIGLAGAPSAPDTMYAIIEANDKEKGVYRSTDFGESWHKQSGYMTSSPQYYNEIVVDPHNPDRVYSMSTFTNVSEDGGKSFSPLSVKFRHVDDHALWIDPDDTDHLYIGGDGGVYETWDRGQTWRHVRNLPIAQFYRIQPDNDTPFYNVCGGTQDNNSLCAPTRTTTVHGITNTDWRIILGGDGYEPQIDPTNPNIIYTQYQYGGLARFDKRTGERVYITPHPGADELQYKWNWNTPLLISPHNPRRLYYGAEKLFVSDDRGDSWRVISPDLTRQVDRNTLKVMGRVWSVDSIAKNDSTSMYGSLIGISESPLTPGLIAVGSDDGVISVTEDGGENWRSVEKFAKVPKHAYISDVQTSLHDADRIYATIDNHKRGDFKPYVLVSNDRGRSWQSISGNLPERGSAHTLVEDHLNPDLLFVGTEFGVFFTQNRGKDWTELSALPTIAVRDLEIQRRENDLVIGTFGRGVYILDDYSALRTPRSALDNAATLFPTRDSWLYIEGDLYYDREKGSSGSAFFTASNPPYGVVFSYHLKDAYKSAKDTRRAAESKIEKDGGDTPYPDWDTLRAEDREDDPALWLVVRNAQGEVIKRVPASNRAGYQRVNWDMRLSPPDAVSLNQPGFVPYWVTPPMGPLATPGEYSVELVLRQNQQLTTLAEAQNFTLKSLDNSPEISRNPAAVQAFQKRAAELQRTLEGARGKISELDERIKHLKKALELTPASDEPMQQQLHGLETRLQDLRVHMYGDRSVASRNEPVKWSISNRVFNVYGGIIESQSDVGGNYRASADIAEAQLRQALSDLQAIDTDLLQFEQRVEAIGAPWTPGRMPALKGTQ